MRAYILIFIVFFLLPLGFMSLTNPREQESNVIAAIVIFLAAIIIKILLWLVDRRIL